MRILILNPGSATLKYRVVDLAGDVVQTVADGNVEHLDSATVSHAAEQVIERCKPMTIQAVACRVVHGGMKFTAPTRVTPEVLQAIRDLAPMAPLHNPVAAAVLADVLRLLPGIPITAIFDTAFHQTIPDIAALYALPLELARKHALRRYGFHGTSHQSIARQFAGVKRLINCHLGSGASICAIREGQSIDTSMGLTPLEGLVMGTRSGDVDPGLLLHLMTAHGYDAARLDHLLNHESGLKGLGGSNDVRDLDRLAARGDEGASLALEIFAYRVRKYIGAYAAALEGLDTLVFTAGIGEHSASMRRRICRGMTWLGIDLDEARNASASGKCLISSSTSTVAVWVVPADEEGEMARACLNASP